MFKKMFDTPFWVWDIARTHGTKQSHMRTKTLLLTAAFGAAGLATSMAQEVFSVNSVGYVNRDLPAGFSMIANPLNQGDNDLDTIMPSVPDGTALFKFDEATQSYEANTPVFVDDAPEFVGWFPSGVTLAPGEGAFINLPSPATITFVGEVMQGNLSNPIPAGFSIRASQVPQQGLVTEQLGLQPSDGDALFRFIGGQFDPDTPTFVDDPPEFVGWFPEEPTIEIGESFFYLTSTAKTWSRSFDVNASN